MEPMQLARCWSLDDGTTCMLSKVGDRAWELRVARAARLIRVEVFSDLYAAVNTAASWRAQFTTDAQIA
jgi:hypothetical protein